MQPDVVNLPQVRTKQWPPMMVDNHIGRVDDYMIAIEEFGKEKARFLRDEK